MDEPESFTADDADCADGTRIPVIRVIRGKNDLGRAFAAFSLR